MQRSAKSRPSLGQSAWNVMGETWRGVWLPLVAIVLFAGVALLARVAWVVLGRAGSGNEGPVAQMQMLIAIAHAFLASTIAVSALHSAKTHGTLARRTYERDLHEARKERVGLIHALTGAAIEASAHSGAMAEFQHRRLRSPRRFIPEFAAEREFALATWNALMGAVSATAKALERLRYTGEEHVLERAEALFDVVIDIQRLATDGRRDDVVSRVPQVRQLADELLLVSKVSDRTVPAR